MSKAKENQTLVQRIKDSYFQEAKYYYCFLLLKYLQDDIYEFGLSKQTFDYLKKLSIIRTQAILPEAPLTPKEYLYLLKETKLLLKIQRDNIASCIQELIDYNHEMFKDSVAISQEHKQKLLDIGVLI